MVYATTRGSFISGAASFAALSGLCVRADVSKPKAVVFNIEKLATHDGPGLRTVAFLKGCPLRCVWCHSPESWSYQIQTYPNGETIGVEMTVEALLTEVLKDKDFYDASKGGVTLSGGEPLAHVDFCEAFFREAKKLGIHTAIETSGFAPASVIDRLLPVVDLWLYDIKVLDPEKCVKLTSRPLKQILENLRRVNAACVATKHGEIVLRCPLIPNLNDDEIELRKRGELADELATVSRIDVEPYVPYGIDKAKRLGLKVYEAVQPPVEYGPNKVLELKRFTHKPVRLG